MPDPVANRAENSTQISWPVPGRTQLVPLTARCKSKRASSLRLSFSAEKDVFSMYHEAANKNIFNNVLMPSQFLKATTKKPNNAACQVDIFSDLIIWKKWVRSFRFEMLTKISEIIWIRDENCGNWNSLRFHGTRHLFPPTIVWHRVTKIHA